MTCTYRVVIFGCFRFLHFEYQEANRKNDNYYKEAPEAEVPCYYNNNNDNRGRCSLKIYNNSNKDYKITRKKELLAPRLRSDKIYPY